MARFASLFKSGRTTPNPQSQSASTIPPTPLTAESWDIGPLGTPTGPPPSSYKYPTLPSAHESTETLRSASSDSTSAYSNTTPVKLSNTPVRGTPSPAPKHIPSLSMSKGSPSPARLRSGTASSSHVPPPALPPPTYALPPTPEASPQKRVSAIYLGPSDTSQSRQTNAPNRQLSRKIGPPPPTSFNPSIVNSHLRTASGTTPLQRSQSGRARSASDGQPPGGSPSSQDGSKRSISRNTAPRPSTVVSGSTSPEAKHRPAALRLRTSNLSPEPKPTSSRSNTGVNAPLAIRSRVRPKADAAVSRPNMLRGESEPLAINPMRISEEFGDNAGSDDSNHTVVLEDRPPIRRIESAEPVLKPLRLVERRRSRSTGDALGLVDLVAGQQQGKLAELVSTTSTPTPGEFTPPRKLGHKYTNSGSSSSVNTPSSALTDLSASTSAAKPRGITPGIPRPFENLPLPWSTIPYFSLRDEIGDDATSSLIDYTITHLNATSPSLLPPAVLKTSVSEEQRLCSELSRLKEKHDHLIQHRESLSGQLDAILLKAEPAKLHKMFQALSKVIARCDRVARQIFICNDQIRQIEIQGQEHVVGALRVALAEKDKEVEWLTERKGEGESSSTNSSAASSAVASSFDLKKNIFTSSATTPTPTDGNGAISLESGSTLWTAHDDEASAQRNSLVIDSRRTSTATVINVNHLTFPIPPDRRQPASPSHSYLSVNSSSTDLGSDIGAYTASPRHEGEIEPELETDLESCDSHNTVSSNTGGNGNEIVIYPPGHHRSLSAPLLLGLNSAYIGGSGSGNGQSDGSMDMPYTPWRSDAHDLTSPSSSSYSHSHERSLSESNYLTPLTANTAFQRSTAPLRVNRNRNCNCNGNYDGSEHKCKLARATAKSLSARGSEMTEEKRRARKGRESTLETPESILLSLATAPLWTKPLDDSYDQYDQGGRMFL